MGRQTFNMAELEKINDELLGALKNLLEAYGVVNDDCDCGGASTCAVCDALAAIAKAEGHEGTK